MNVKVKRIIVVVIFSIFFISSSILGIYQLSIEKEKYKNYNTIIGEFESSNIYSSSDDGDTYSLTYRYYVRGTMYTVSTNYGTSLVPKKGTSRKIKYNKDNPSDAFVVGVELSELCLLVIFISFVLLSCSLKKIIMKDSKKKEANIWDFSNQILIGILIIYGDSLIYELITGTKNFFSILEFFPSYGFVLLFVLVFLLLGIYFIGYTVYTYFPKKKKEKKTDFELEQENLRREEIEQDITKIVEKTVVVGTWVNNIAKLLVSGFITFILVNLFYMRNTNMDFTFILFTLPFVLVAVSIFIVSFIDFLNLCFKKEEQNKGETLKIIFSYVPIIAFLLFWFGFLTVMCYICIGDNQWEMVIFTIPFWLAGIYTAVVFMKGRKGK